MADGRLPIVCDICKKRCEIPFDALFEHVEFEAVKAGFRIGQNADLRWWTRCEECAKTKPRGQPP